jgi:hypothetical protein
MLICQQCRIQFNAGIQLDQAKMLKVVAFRYIGTTKPTWKMDMSVSSGLFAACPAHV